MMLFAYSRAASETMLVMVAVAVACAVPGVLLVLRRLVLVADAMSHVLLLGIVLAYFVVPDPASSALFFGAAASGLFTAAAVEWLQRGRYLKEDAAIGLLFPAFFSVGTILASLYLRNTHLDIDRVLLGSAEFAFLDRITLGGRDLGPRSAVVLFGTAIITHLAIAVAYKELKLSLFDRAYAQLLGFAPGVIYYTLMAGISVTTVAAFDAVGPVLVLAFFAIPALCARMLTDRLFTMFAISLGVAIGSAIVGTMVAIAADTTIAGTVCGVLGISFAISVMFAPRRGIIWRMLERKRQRRQFEMLLLVIHLQTHEGTPQHADESHFPTLHMHLNWTPRQTTNVVHDSQREGYLHLDQDHLSLTPAGHEFARELHPVGPRLAAVSVSHQPIPPAR